MEEKTQISETKEFKLLLNLLDKIEQIISIINLPDSSISKYNTLKKMTFDMLNINFTPLQKRKLDENIENKNEPLNILFMLNKQKIMLIELLLDYIRNNNSIFHEKNLEHYLGSLTEIYNLSKENFDIKTEEEIFYEVNSEINTLAEIFNRIDKTFVDNFDINKQIRINYENELKKLREKFDKDLDELKISLGNSNFSKQIYMNYKDYNKINDIYLNQLSNLIDEFYEKSKICHPNEVYENIIEFNQINNSENLKLNFIKRVMSKYFEENNEMKLDNFNLNNNDFHSCKNCVTNKKLDDICSFLPNIQKESDSFHKKFCELMNYIETNIEEKS